MSTSHGEHDIRVLHESIADGLGYVITEVETSAVHDFDRFRRNATPCHGGDAGGHDEDSAVLQFVGLTIQFFGQPFPQHGFGHRAAASVSRTDQDDQESGQPLQGGIVHDPRSQDVHSIVPNLHDGRRLAVSTLTVVQHQIDVIAECLDGLPGGCGGRIADPVAPLRAIGPARRSRTSRIKSWAGTQPNRVAGADGLLHRGRQARLHEARSEPQLSSGEFTSATSRCGRWGVENALRAEAWLALAEDATDPRSVATLLTGFDNAFADPESTHPLLKRKTLLELR